MMKTNSKSLTRLCVGGGYKSLGNNVLKLLKGGF